jgi:hypothetical protein
VPVVDIVLNKVYLGQVGRGCGISATETEVGVLRYEREVIVAISECLRDGSGCTWLGSAVGKWNPDKEIFPIPASVSTFDVAAWL